MYSCSNLFKEFLYSYSSLGLLRFPVANIKYSQSCMDGCFFCFCFVSLMVFRCSDISWNIYLKLFFSNIIYPEFLSALVMLAILFWIVEAKICYVLGLLLGTVHSGGGWLLVEETRPILEMVGKSSAATVNSLCLIAQRIGNFDGKAVKNSDLKTLLIIAYSPFKHFTRNDGIAALFFGFQVNGHLWSLLKCLSIPRHHQCKITKQLWF